MRKTLLILLVTLSTGVTAETLYVTDRLEITLRSGETTRHKILRMLPSGTPVEVMRKSAESGYSQVRALGTEGYVLTRQLMDEPSARDQLDAMRARLEALQENPDRLASRLASLQQEFDSLRATHAQLDGVKQRLEQDLEGVRRTSADAIRIAEERNELRKTVTELTRQLEDLKQENRDLSNSNTRDWFLIGAGVVIAGILLGLILPHLRFQRRKSSWGSL